MSELTAENPEELRRYCPQLRYFLVDEMALPESELPGAGNLVAMLIRRAPAYTSPASLAS